MNHAEASEVTDRASATEKANADYYNFLRQKLGALSLAETRWIACYEKGTEGTKR